VGLGGLEPPTSSLSVKRSNHLSYRPVEPSKSYGICKIFPNASFSDVFL